MPLITRVKKLPSKGLQDGEHRQYLVYMAFSSKTIILLSLTFFFGTETIQYEPLLFLDK